MSEVEPEWLGDVRTTKLTRLGQNGSAIISRFSAHAHLEGPSPASTSSRCGKVSTSNRPRRTSSVRIAASSSP